MGESCVVELPMDKMVELLELKIENVEDIDCDMEDAVQQSPPQTTQQPAKKKTKKYAKKKARRPTQEPIAYSVILRGCRNCRKLRRYIRKDQRKVGCSRGLYLQPRARSVRQVLAEAALPKAPAKQETKAGFERGPGSRGRRPRGCSQRSVASLVLEGSLGQTRRSRPPCR